MVERLLQMRVLLKSTGSIYLHCDPTASHYIKVMMDGIFGHKNFRNEIVWFYKRMATSKQKHFSRCHDILLFYSKTSSSFFNPNLVRLPYSESSKKRAGYKKTSLGGGSPSSGICELNKGGRFPEDWWDIPIIRPNSKERLGYPTQKPIALLDRIIKASCSPDGVVFDPFCGCGTTIYSAIKNQKRWIGCDIAILPVKLIKHQLEEKYRLVEQTHFKIDGVPVSFEQAETLMQSSPHQFQHWVVEHVGGFPTKKKSGDKGVDGRLYIETREGLKDMILSVKGGENITPSAIRELRGTLERENNAVLAGFISLHEPTKGMRGEAAQAGMWEYNGVSYERIQLLSVKDILEDKKAFHTPTQIGIKGKTGQMNLPI